MIGMAKALRKKEDFFKHISGLIKSLAKTYSVVVKELDFLESKSEIRADVVDSQYRFLAERLKRAIETFKDEMAASLQEYYFQVDNDMLSPHTIAHVKNELDILKNVYKSLGKKIPDRVLKEVLGANYFFHNNMRKLTPNKLLEYFELNYMMHKNKK